MSKRKTISAYFKTEISKRSPYVQEMRKAIELFDESKIERKDTLQRIFSLLKSKGEKSNQQGVELLNKYTIAAPAKGKVKRQAQELEDSQKVELDVSVQATAFGGKTKKVNAAPKLIGARAAANINM